MFKFHQNVFLSVCNSTETTQHTTVNCLNTLKEPLLAVVNNIAVQGVERKVDGVWQEHWSIKPYPILFPLKGLS